MKHLGMLLEPLQVLLKIGSVDNKEVTITQAVDQQVVYDTSVRVTHD